MNSADRDDQQMPARRDPLARWRALRDAEPGQRALYTTVKDDHPAIGPSDEPCGCEQGDARWEATAMRVHWPRQTDREAGQ